MRTASPLPTATAAAHHPDIETKRGGTKVPPLLRGMPPEGLMPWRAGPVFSQSLLLYSTGRGPGPLYRLRRGFWIQHSCCPPWQWRGLAFACYFPAMERYQRFSGRPYGVLLFIAMLCNRANLSPLLSGQKWQNPPGETPGPPLRRIRMGLVAPHTPDRVWRLRMAPPGKKPSANAAKNMGKQYVWRHLSPAGIPSGLPPGQVVLGDRLGRRRPSAGD